MAFMQRILLASGWLSTAKRRSPWAWTEVAIGAILWSSAHAGRCDAKIFGVPIRIYSAAKTIDDCLKYRKKIGRRFAGRMLQESVAKNKCGEQRL